MHRKITVILGIILVLISSLGILMGSFSLFSVSPAAQSHLNEADFNRSMQNMQQTMDEPVAGVRFEDVQRTMASPEFKKYLYGMAGFGFLINLLLLASGVLLIRENAKGYWIVAGTSIVLSLYWYGMTHSFCEVEADLAGKMDPFSAAWGVGNMGVALLPFSYFWIWGPVLAGLMLLWLRREKASLQ